MGERPSNPPSYGLPEETNTAGVAWLALSEPSEFRSSVTHFSVLACHVRSVIRIEICSNGWSTGITHEPETLHLLASAPLLKGLKGLKWA